MLSLSTNESPLCDYIVISKSSVVFIMGDIVLKLKPKPINAWIAIFAAEISHFKTIHINH